MRIAPEQQRLMILSATCHICSKHTLPTHHSWKGAVSGLHAPAHAAALDCSEPLRHLPDLNDCWVTVTESGLAFPRAGDVHHIS
jgi:hypothetical protein